MGQHAAALGPILLCGLLACAPDAVLVEQGDPLMPPCNAVYSTLPQAECDLYLQDCEGAELCVAANTGTDFTTVCSPSFGGKAAGEPCDNTTECDTSLSCLSGFCSPVCCPSNNLPCGKGGYCVGKQMYDDYLVLRCRYGEPCELFVAGSCASPDDACRFIPTVGAAICLSPHGTQPQGEPCDDFDDCGEGQMCHAIYGSSGACRYNCLLGAPEGTPPGLGGCPDGQPCADLGLGLDGVGVCTP